MFEELLERDGRIANDIKLFCFSGKFAYAEINSDRFERHRQTQFDLHWNRLPSLSILCGWRREDSHPHSWPQQ